MAFQYSETPRRTKWGLRVMTVLDENPPQSEVYRSAWRRFVERWLV